MLETSLHGFALWQWGVMLAIAAASGVIHGFVGVGFPLVATPLFGLLFGWKAAVALLVLPTWLVTFACIRAFRGQADLRVALRTYWPLPLAMPFGLAAGVHALHRVPPAALMLLMAGVMAAYLLLDRFGHTDLPTARAHPTALALPFGLAAGFCEGSVNVAAPMLLIYFFTIDLPVASMIAVMNWLFLLGKSVQALLMAQRGALDAAALVAALPLGALGVAGYVLGLRLRARFDPARYRGWLKAMLAVMAVSLVLRVLSGAAT